MSNLVGRVLRGEQTPSALIRVIVSILCHILKQLTQLTPYPYYNADKP